VRIEAEGRICASLQMRTPREDSSLYTRTAGKLAEHFVAAEVRHFPYDQLDSAIEWARAERRRGDLQTGILPS